MTTNNCDQCDKKYNPDNHTWSAGFGCDYYCSKQCCNEAWDDQNESLGRDDDYPECPCY